MAVCGGYARRVANSTSGARVRMHTGQERLRRLPSLRNPSGWHRPDGHCGSQVAEPRATCTMKATACVLLLAACMAVAVQAQYYDRAPHGPHAPAHCLSRIIARRPALAAVQARVVAAV